jgi:small subunit ribosomal protein S18
MLPEKKKTKIIDTPAIQDITLDSQEIQSSDFVDVDFDDNYGDLKIHKDHLEKLSRSEIALIKHRGKLQLFNRKSFATPINEINLNDISYKNANLLKKFLTLGHNMISSRNTLTTYRRQRVLKVAIKRARELALLPYAGQKYKNDGGFNS